MKTWLKANWMLLVGALFVVSGLTVIASDLVTALVTIAIGVVLVVLHFRRAAKIKAQPKSATFDVTGLYYYRSELALIRSETSDWSKTAAQIFERKGRGAVKAWHYRYPHSPVELRPEPDNPHDKNAVGVYFAGKQIGHVPKEHSTEAAAILSRHSVQSITGRIVGGEYKQFYTDGSFTVEDSEQDTLRATVTINYV